VQLSNGNVYQKTHDELDFEFLGNVRGREWRVQTNVYGNGSTDAGREERYDLPFDPTDEFHHYSILWTQERIVYVTFLHLASCNSLQIPFPCLVPAGHSGI
jgi:xyloglucan:xyloglucosyl transferase